MSKRTQQYGDVRVLHTMSIASHCLNALTWETLPRFGVRIHTLFTDGLVLNMYENTFQGHKLNFHPSTPAAVPRNSTF
jgi:hypothetical protein